ncbi:MAG TPA: hypothetical protein VFZ73_17570, partial [Gemmatimonadaceae bacterium]
LRVPRRFQGLGVIVTAAVPALAGVAIWSLTGAAPRALAVMAGTSTSVVPRGFGGISGGALLMVIAVALLLISRMKASSSPNAPPF